LPAPVQKTNSVALKAAGETNVLTAAAISGDPTDPSNEAEGEEKLPAIDVNLQEAERMMVDFFSVLTKENALLVTH
jgi:hypothetical protein